MSEIQLGDEAKDTITGYKGVVVCVGQWLHGCKRLTIQPQGLKDGKPHEALTFDLPQLVLVKSNGHIPNVSKGGPRPEPVRR